MHKKRVLLLLTVLLGILACVLMPWITEEVNNTTRPVSNGLNIYDVKFYGFLALMLFLVVAFLAMRGNQKEGMSRMSQVLVCVAGVLIIATLALFVSNYNARMRQEEKDLRAAQKEKEHSWLTGMSKGVKSQLTRDYHFSWGIWMGMLAGLLLVLIPLMYRLLFPDHKAQLRKATVTPVIMDDTLPDTTLPSMADEDVGAASGSDTTTL